MKKEKEEEENKKWSASNDVRDITVGDRKLKIIRKTIPSPCCV